MDFETLINSPKEVIREYLKEPKKLKKMEVNLSQLGELIKKAGESITYVENIGKRSNLIGNSIDEEEILDYGTEICNFLVDLIKDTGKLEEYLKNEPPFCSTQFSIPTAPNPPLVSSFPGSGAAAFCFLYAPILLK